MYEYRKLMPEQRAEVVEERLARGFPAHSPPHLIREQPFYLLTAACYEHKRHMRSQERRRQILNRLTELFSENGMEILAWTVLPNHYHLLVHVTDFGVLGRIFRLAHGAASRQWNLEDDALGRKIWYRYADRAIRSERHYYTTLNYIHYNPVKHGLVRSPYAWEETSVHWYLEHHGREWLRDLWAECPIRDYGCGWDDL